MSRPRNVIPSYRFHKPSGSAYADYTDPSSGIRRSIRLGLWNSPESRAEHARLCAQLAAGITTRITGLTVAEVCIDYLKHCQTYYVKGGKQTDEVAGIKAMVKHLHVLYGHTLAAEFGPAGLKAVREAMVRAGNARTTVNKQVGRMRRMFRWAVGESMIPVPHKKI